jgi:hypothetical protein
MTTNLNRDLLASIIDRAEVSLSTSGGRRGIPEWIQTNTTAPGNAMKNWSFEGHEFQKGILEDQSPAIAIQKSSQCGISEIMVRFLLALASKLSGQHLLLVLPTSHFASKFVSSRLDPVIQASKRLEYLASKKVRSSELIQISSSYIHIGGAATENQAISVPGKVLLVDETSFCNPDTISVYQSRLGHQRPEDRIIVYYSTPLYPKSGISDLFDSGTQNLYMCYHDACNTWVPLDSTQDLVLPGFDKPLIELTLTDLRSGYVSPSQAWCKCPQCGNPISQQNLADPTRRAWVPKYPDRLDTMSSYQIGPLDVASIKTPESIINELKLYKKTSRWVQFALGRPFESSDATITEAALTNAFTVTPIAPSVATKEDGLYNVVAGYDQGKAAYLCHGRKSNGVLEIFNVETVMQDGDNGQAETYLERARQFNVVKGTIDAGPDSSLVKYVQGRTPFNSTWGCYFVRSNRKSTLDLFTEDPATGMVKANRTAIFDDFVKAFNGGKIKLPRGSRHENEIKAHFLSPKRITVPDAVGEEQSSWVSSGADHFLLACLYAYLASLMIDAAPAQIFIPPTRLVTSVKMRSSPSPAGF